jgi:hypothetical protein
VLTVVTAYVDLFDFSMLCELHEYILKLKVGYDSRAKMIENIRKREIPTWKLIAGKSNRSNRKTGRTDAASR